mgnify:FL=1
MTQEQIDEMEPKPQETVSEPVTEDASASSSEGAPHEVVELDDTQVKVEKVKVDATET